MFCKFIMPHTSSSLADHGTGTQRLIRSKDQGRPADGVGPIGDVYTPGFFTLFYKQRMHPRV